MCSEENKMIPDEGPVGYWGSISFIVLGVGIFSCGVVPFFDYFKNGVAHIVLEEVVHLYGLEAMVMGGFFVLSGLGLIFLGYFYFAKYLKRIRT
jgi:hypothetical protein